MKPLCKENIQKIFLYKDGFLYWKEKGKNRRINVPVGTIDKDGYIVVGYNKKIYRVHRLIWIYHNGDIPFNIEIDHINHIKGDNKIENLRIAEKIDNSKNRPLQKNNLSGSHGISWHKISNKWRVRIKHKGKEYYLGLFVSIEEAVKERKKAEKIFEFHKNHGSK